VEIPVEFYAGLSLAVAWKVLCK